MPKGDWLRERHTDGISNHMNDESKRDSNDQAVGSVETTSEIRSQTGITAQTPLPPEFPPLRPLEPTRYGDWEKAGRCIDF
jgi:hypothetical protein